MHILKTEYYEVGQHIAGMGTTDFIIKSNFHNNSVLIFQADSNSAGTQVDMRRLDVALSVRYEAC